MTTRHGLASEAVLGVAVVLCCAAGLLLPVVTNAQNTAAGLEEVTVTARKRDEKLLDIPLTISVLTAKSIDEKGIRELNQVVDFTPGFFYGGPSVGSNSRNNRRLLIRGMQFNTDVQTKQGATLFIDGAPVLGAEIGRLSAIERIEVVKGPQSAYYGRSTFSGAINVITRNPGSEWQRTVRAEAASYGTTDLGFSIEGPILGDRLTFRFDASNYRTKGQYDNAGGLRRKDWASAKPAMRRRRSSPSPTKNSARNCGCMLGRMRMARLRGSLTPRVTPRMRSIVV